MRDILSSAHVHTTFCDGKSTSWDRLYELLFLIVVAWAKRHVNFVR